MDEYQLKYYISVIHLIKRNPEIKRPVEISYNGYGKQSYDYVIARIVRDKDFDNLDKYMVFMRDGIEVPLTEYLDNVYKSIAYLH